VNRQVARPVRHWYNPPMLRRPTLSATLAALLLLAGARTARAQAPGSGQKPFNDADVHFMTGMISHHAQAVRMASWATSHGAGDAVRGLCARVQVGQTDEIHVMQRWLAERHLMVPDSTGAMAGMPGMDHAMTMPGMLTPAQMAELDGARGREFDRLFLIYMIQHHQGALTMVHTLFESPGALMDDMIFKFASDISADQTTEIDRMSRMLAALSAP